MALKHLLARIGRETKQDVSNAAVQACVVEDLNGIAERMHTDNELQGTVHKPTFDLGESPDKVVTFPWNVDTILGIRYAHDPDNPIPISTPALAISHTSEFRAWHHIPMTEITRVAPFHTSMTSYTKLTFTINSVYGVDIKIDVEGPTEDSEFDVETVTLAAGSLSVTTTKVFTAEPHRITKTKLCTPDITITDINDNELGKIIGRRFSPMYLKIQINYTTGTSTRSSTSRYIEVAYKHRFMPFFNLQDSFLGAEAEEALFWSYMSRALMAKNVELAARHSNRSKGILKGLFLKDIPKNHIVEYGPEKAFNILNEDY